MALVVGTGLDLHGQDMNAEAGRPEEVVVSMPEMRRVFEERKWPDSCAEHADVSEFALTGRMMTAGRHQ